MNKNANSRNGTLSRFSIVSDIAVFVLKRDVKLQLTNIKVFDVLCVQTAVLNVNYNLLKLLIMYAVELKCVV